SEEEIFSGSQIYGYDDPFFNNDPIASARYVSQWQQPRATPGNFAVYASHTFLEAPDPIRATVTVSGSDGTGPISQTEKFRPRTEFERPENHRVNEITVTLSPPAWGGTEGHPLQILDDVLGTFTDTRPAHPEEAYVATIYWGDG